MGWATKESKEREKCHLDTLKRKTCRERRKRKERKTKGKSEQPREREAGSKEREKEILQPRKKKEEQSPFTTISRRSSRRVDFCTVSSQTPFFA